MLHHIPIRHGRKENGHPSATMRGMATRRVLKSALVNFLGTYSSRYSDYDGYWLFGFLVGELNGLRIDLLAQSDSDANGPRGAALRCAKLRFEEQCRKSGLVPSQVREGWLTMALLPGSVRGTVNGRPCEGRSLRFTAEAVTDLGRSYKRELVIFVAPHNANIECRSSRATA
jgi:hypothetical protein